MNSPPYLLVDYPAPHADRARQIMRAHPEVRNLFGHNAWTALWIVLIVAAQLALGAWLTPYPWWTKLLAGYCIGAFANHALWVLVHECTHNLVFRNRTANRWMALLCNLPMFIPMTASFSAYHIKHHKYLGDRHHDADIASPWEAWLFRHPPLGRLAWQCLFPILQPLRTVWLDRTNLPNSWTGWVWLNVVTQIAFNVGFFWTFGQGSLLYFVCSAYFSVGPHPLGARWIQEHYVVNEGQETYSYYGGLNRVAFNIGYHNEHHDLPQVPWNRLPRLKGAAPEMYDSLRSHPSWTRLWLRFLFDRRWEVHRIAREERSTPVATREATATTAEKSPDVLMDLPQAMSSPS